MMKFNFVVATPHDTVFSKTAIRFGIRTLCYDTEGRKRLYGAQQGHRQMNRVHLKGMTPTQVFDIVTKEIQITKPSFIVKQFSDFVQPYNTVAQTSLFKEETNMDIFAELKKAISKATKANQFDTVIKLTEQLIELQKAHNNQPVKLVEEVKAPTVVTLVEPKIPALASKLFVMEKLRDTGSKSIRFGMKICGTNMGISTSVVTMGGNIERRSIKAQYVNRMKSLKPTSTPMNIGDIVLYTGSTSKFQGTVGVITNINQTGKFTTISLYRMTGVGLVEFGKVNNISLNSLTKLRHTI